MRITAVFFFFACALLCAGCRSHQEQVPDFDFKAGEADKLTPAERQAIVYHARQFVSQSKNLKIDKVAREIIRDTEPEMKMKYFGRKYGQIRMKWQLNRATELDLSGTGDMLSDEFPWKLQVKVLDESHPIPERLKKNLPKASF